MSTLSRQVTVLKKKMKSANPSHVYTLSAVAAFGATANSSTNIFNISDQIAEGDAYNQRFGTHIKCLRLCAKIHMGAASANTSTEGVGRVVVFRAQPGTSLAVTVADVNTAAAIPANNVMTKIYYDKQVGLVPVTADTGPTFDINVPLNHQQRYSGSTSGTSIGDCIWLACITSYTSGGGLAPNLHGWIELWFSP